MQTPARPVCTAFAPGFVAPALVALGAGAVLAMAGCALGSGPASAAPAAPVAAAAAPPASPHESPAAVPAQPTGDPAPTAASDVASPVATAVAVAPAGASDPFSSPDTVPAADGWEQYQGMPTLTVDNVQNVRPGTGTPEAAVAHFYASVLRGDRAYQDVLSPDLQGDARKQRKLAKVLGWTFKQVRLERRKQSDTGIWIKIFFELDLEGRSESGTDDVGVEQLGDRWLIASVPN